MLSELQASLTDEQRVLLATVATVYFQHGRWPNWAWVDETLERRGLVAQVVLSSLPREAVVGYGPVWPTGVAPMQPKDQLGLTIAGLRHLPQASTLVSDHLLLIKALGTIRANVSLDPFDTAWPKATAREVTQTALKLGRREPEPINPARLDFMANEPATWQCVVVSGTIPEDWTIELSPQIRRFAGVHDVDDYLERLSLVLAPVTSGAQEPVLASPFTLPAAVDYLDAIWWRKFGSGLVVAPGLERSARLAFDVNSAAEADSALSALAEVLKSLEIPGVNGMGGHPLQRLLPYLREHLSTEAMPAIENAVAILNAARQVRAGAQHVQAQSRVVDALALLDLPYPVVDWPSAWRQIQQAVAYACDVIRQELHASL